ncbi:hypothetical protein Tco_0927297 [Tanacetum coccineum]
MQQSVCVVELQTFTSNVIGGTKLRWRHRRERKETLCRVQGNVEQRVRSAEHDKKDRHDAFLYQALTEDVILQVAGCKTARELWESLKKRHVGEERVQQARLQSLMIGFNTLQMKDDDTVDAFTAKLNSYATKAKELGENLDESL